MLAAVAPRPVFLIRHMLLEALRGLAKPEALQTRQLWTLLGSLPPERTERISLSPLSPQAVQHLATVGVQVRQTIADVDLISNYNGACRSRAIGVTTTAPQVSVPAAATIAGVL